MLSSAARRRKAINTKNAVLKFAMSIFLFLYFILMYTIYTYYYNTYYYIIIHTIYYVEINIWHMFRYTYIS